jgi:hypothetical protein
MLNLTDLQVVFTKLADGRRIARLTHLPTGIFVEQETTNEVIAELRDKQIKLLEEKLKVVSFPDCVERNEPGPGGTAPKSPGLPSPREEPP